MLLNLIKERNLKSIKELKSYIETNIGTLNSQLLEKSASTTRNDEMRRVAKEIDLLKSFKNQFFKFL